MTTVATPLISMVLLLFCSH